MGALEEILILTAIQSMVFSTLVSLLHYGVLPKMDPRLMYSSKSWVSLEVCIRSITLVILQPVILLSFLRVDDAWERYRIARRKAAWNALVDRHEDRSLSVDKALLSGKRTRFPEYAVVGSLAGTMAILAFLLSLQSRGYSTDQIRDHVHSCVVLCIGLALANWALSLNGVPFLGSYRPTLGMWERELLASPPVQQKAKVTTAIKEVNRATTQGTSTIAGDNTQLTRKAAVKKIAAAKKAETSEKAEAERKAGIARKARDEEKIQANQAKQTHKASKKRERRGKQRPGYRCRLTQSLRRTFPWTYRVLQWLLNICQRELNMYQFYRFRWHSISTAIVAQMDQEDIVTGTNPGDLVFYKRVDPERADSGVCCLVITDCCPT